jgi:hypothetical protein
MPRSQDLHAEAIATVTRYMSLALRLRRETIELVAATQETMAQSRALIADIDALLATGNSRTHDLWPPY